MTPKWVNGTNKIREPFTTSKICVQEGYWTVLGKEKKDDSTNANKEDILKKLKKGSGIGASIARVAILNKLQNIDKK